MFILSNRFGNDGSPKSLQAYLESVGQTLTFKFRFILLRLLPGIVKRPVLDRAVRLAISPWRTTVTGE